LTAYNEQTGPMIYNADGECIPCGESIGAPHAPGCIHGDGFEGVAVETARSAARGSFEHHHPGQTLDTDALDRFYLRTLTTDIVADGVVHAYAGQVALIREPLPGEPTAFESDLFSMVTGWMVRVDDTEYRQVVDELGVPMRVGDLVYNSQRTATVTEIDDSDPAGGVIAIDFHDGREPLRTAAATVRRVVKLFWTVQVTERHEGVFPLYKLAKVLDADPSQVAVLLEADILPGKVEDLLIQHEHEHDDETVDITTDDRRIDTVRS
jgi:hypothetical protein